MYTRDYTPQEEKISVPENYVGNAFDVNKSEMHQRESQPTSSPENESEPVMKRTGAFDGFFKRLPFSNLLSGFNFFHGGFDSFGTEEILIIGVALFLLFGKNGDKECALLLLLLLFIK